MQLSEQDEIATELEEWIQSFDAVVAHSGKKSATNILYALDKRAKELELIHEAPKFSPYRNTISIAEQPRYPGNLKLEEKITAVLRWNALAMVMRANRHFGDLGGHIAS